MPVTAKLSRKFYDALGDDVANELVEWFNAVDLTYRTDLRDLNELNHARFEAKLSEGLAKLGADLELKLGALRAELKQDIAEARAAAKNDLAAVRDDLTAVRVDLAAAIAALKHDLIGVQHDSVGVRAAAKQDFAEARATARQDLADTRADLIKWMFLFWLGSVAASVASRFF